MMVVMGHGLCVSFWVSGEMTKNKVGPKKVQWNLELDRGRLARGTLANKWRGISEQTAGVRTTKNDSAMAIIIQTSVGEELVG